MTRQSEPRSGLEAGRRCRVLAGAASMAVLLATSAPAQSMPASLSRFLQDTAGFTADEMRSADRGMPVVKLLGTPDRREVALIGVEKIEMPRAFYVQRASDFPSSLREPSRIGLGVFSEPAAPADVAALTLPHDDVRALAQCRPGSCKLKLPASTIIDLRATVDLSAPAADSAVRAYFAGRMIDYVTAYRARGNRALVVYNDSPDSTAAAQVWDGILSRSPYIYGRVPSLDRFFRSYPDNQLSGAREVIFWAMDDVPGAKPLLTITHEVVYTPPELPGTTLLAAKQLYCDHYLDGALDLFAVVEPTAVAASDSPGIYLVLLRRLHFDDLPSGGIVNVKGKVIGKLRDRTLAFLRDTKQASEQAFAAQRSNPH